MYIAFAGANHIFEVKAADKKSIETCGRNLWKLGANGMPAKLKRKLFIGIIVTAVIIYFCVRTLKGLHPGALFHMKIHWGLVVVSVIVYIYANYIRGLAFTLGIDREMDRMTAFQVMGIGHTANMIFPLHAGEGLRAAFFPPEYNAMRRTKLLIISAAADTIAIILFSLLAVPFSGFMNPALLKALWILAAVCIAGAVLFVIILLSVPRFRKYSKEYLSLDMAKMMFWVMLSWGLLLFSTWLGLAAFGFQGVEVVRMSLAVFAATNIINFIPASPGAIGLFEYGVILGLGGLGIDRSTALAVALLLHMIQYVALLPMGAVLYFHALHGKYGKALKEEWRKKQE